MIVADLLTKAKKLNNYDIDATAGGLSIDDQNYKVVVPAGKRWYVIGGAINRDVSSTVTGFLYDSSDNIIGLMSVEGAATGIAGFPRSALYIGQGLPIPLDPGEYFKAYFAVAQTGAAFCSFIVLEVGI